MLTAHKYKLIIGIGVVILITLLIINWARQRKPTVSPEPTVSSGSFNSVQSVPTIAVSGSSGVNIKSPEVATSISTIEKLNAKLPYKTSVKLDSGESTPVYIPRVSKNAHRWLLTVLIDEVDYEIPDSSPDMPKHKALFLKGAQATYDWLESQNVDPKNIIILWGDTQKVQDRSLEWLQQQ